MSKTKLNAAAPQPPLPDGGEEPSLSDSTFEDWGKRLPIGVLADGGLHRGFEFRRFTMKEERALEALRKKRRRTSMGEFVAGVLSHMLTQLGPYDFAGLKESERRLLVHQMWLPDVMYAYVWLRIDALGEMVKFRLQCPTCAHKYVFPADLHRTDVTIAENMAALVYTHSLRDGLETADGLVHDLILQPPRWSAYAALKADSNVGDAKLRTMMSAIRQIGDGKFPATLSIVESLTKFDLEHLQKVIDDRTPGPDLDLETECSGCGSLNHAAMDWTWDFFFTASSL